MTFLNGLIQEGLKSSNVVPAGPTPIISTPCRFIGNGKITFGNGVVFGTKKGPDLYSMSQLVVGDGGEIDIGDDVVLNNNFYIFAYGAKIVISMKTIIGSNLQIMSFNGHQMNPSNRRKYDQPKSIYIGSNCWLGNNVTVLKGSIIGSDSVISTGSIVNEKHKIPEKSIVKIESKNLSIEKLNF
jgi:maltose O-acetyltransferase